jgi:putative FmdB family regulatory protein
MPIYEYQCGSCGSKKEHLQKLSEAPVLVCPECGSNAYTKLISAVGFQLKGSGWYATDFKNGSKSKPEEEKEVKSKVISATNETAPKTAPDPVPAASNGKVPPCTTK